MNDAFSHLLPFATTLVKLLLHSLEFHHSWLGLRILILYVTLPPRS